MSVQWQCDNISIISIISFGQYPKSITNRQYKIYFLIDNDMIRILIIIISFKEWC